MFRALTCPSSGVCDFVVELPHWLFRSWFAVCWSLGADRTGWYPGCRVKLGFLFFNYHNDARFNIHQIYEGRDGEFSKYSDRKCLSYFISQRSE